MRFVNASRKNIGLPLVISAARLRECRGYACLSGEAYEVNNGYTARLREEGSSALHQKSKVVNNKIYHPSPPKKLTAKQNITI